MAAAMASMVLMWIFISFLGRKPSLVTAINIATTSTISAAPAAAALLPETDSPLASSPALSPDITPLFPTTGGPPAFSPADTALPTIPSNQSPPNPDAIGAAPGPFSPLDSLPVSSAVRYTPLSRIQLLGSAASLLFLPGLIAWFLI